MTEDFLQGCDVFCFTEIECGKGVSANLMRDGLADASNSCNFFEVSVHRLVRKKLFEYRTFLPVTNYIRHQHLERLGDGHYNRFRLRVSELDAVVGKCGLVKLLQLQFLSISDVQAAEA